MFFTGFLLSIILGQKLGVFHFSDKIPTMKHLANILLGLALAIGLAAGCAGKRKRQTVSAVAQLDLGEQLFGCPVDKNYRPLPGQDGATLFPTGVLETVTDSRIEHKFVVFADPNELWATLPAWEFIRQQSDYDADTRFGVYRVFETTHVIKYLEQGEMRDPPPSAMAYINEITYGYLHEVVLYGDKSKFHTGAVTQFLLASGRIEDFANRFGLKVQHVSWGLTPSVPQRDAVFATSHEEIAQHYSREYQQPVPIFVDYKILPDVEFKDGVQIEFKRPPEFETGEYRIQVRTGVVAPTRLDGRVWDDFLGGMPDPMVEVYVHACRDLLYVSQPQNNTYTPTWSKSHVAELAGSDRLCIRVYDSDDDDQKEEIGVCETRDLASERYLGNKIVIKQCGRVANLEIEVTEASSPSK